MQIIELIIFIIFLLIFILVILFRRKTIQIESIKDVKRAKSDFESLQWSYIRRYVEEGKFDYQEIIRIIKENLASYYEMGLINEESYKKFRRKIEVLERRIYFFVNKRKLFIDVLNDYLKIRNVSG